MASTTFLKFCPELTKELRQDPVNKEAQKGEEKAVDKAEELPATPERKEIAAPESRDVTPPAGGGEGDEATKQVEKITAQESSKAVDEEIVDASIEVVGETRLAKKAVVKLSLLKKPVSKWFLVLTIRSVPRRAMLLLSGLPLWQAK